MLSTSPAELDLSSTATATAQELGDLRPPHTLDRAALAKTHVLRVEHCRLTSLFVSPSCPLGEIVRHVRVLHASHNRLTTLHGIDALPALEELNVSFNELRVVDAHGVALLRGLPHLRTLDLSHNHLTLLDCGASVRPNGVSRPHAARRPSLEEEENMLHVTALNLSHNALLELPDLRCMPLLESLDLSHNHLDDLGDLDTKLPLVALRTLRLRCNRLDRVAAVTPLGALAHTLQHLQLSGNPFARETTPEEGRWWWRAFVLWLVPLLTTLDTVVFSAEERQTARQLFREHDALSPRLIALLNDQHRAELEVYLRKQCRGVVAPRELGAAVRQLDADDARPIDTTPRTASGETRHGKGVVASLNTSTGGSPVTAPLAVVVQAMQQKLKSFSAVLETLWKADLVRRTFAAIVIQKYMRSALVRMHLTQETREYCDFIRHQLRRLRNPAVCVAAAVATLQQAALTAAPNVKPTSGAASDMQEIVQSMRSLGEVMARMYGDLDEFRAVVARERRRAAICIQRHFRGHLARREWRALRAGYDEFVQSLQPYVCRLQRVGRAGLVRRGMCERHGQQLEVRRLSREVQALRDEVREMRRLMSQTTRLGGDVRVPVYGGEDAVPMHPEPHTAALSSSTTRVSEPDTALLGSTDGRGRDDAGRSSRRLSKRHDEGVKQPLTSVKQNQSLTGKTVST